MKNDDVFFECDPLQPFGQVPAIEDGDFKLFGINYYTINLILDYFKIRIK